jgi:hypothetical protein
MLWSSLLESVRNAIFPAETPAALPPPISDPAVPALTRAVLPDHGLKASSIACTQACAELRGLVRSPFLNDRALGLYELIDTRVPLLRPDHFSEFFVEFGRVLTASDAAPDSRRLARVEIWPIDLAFAVGLMATKAGALSFDNTQRLQIASALDSFVRIFRSPQSVWPGGERMLPETRQYYEAQFERFTHSGQNSKQGDLCLFGLVRSVSPQQLRESVAQLWTLPYEPELGLSGDGLLRHSGSAPAFRFGRRPLDGLIPLIHGARKYSDRQFVEAGHFILRHVVVPYQTDAVNEARSNLTSCEALILLDAITSCACDRGLNTRQCAPLGSAIPAIADFFEWDRAGRLTKALSTRLFRIRNVLAF